MDDLIAATMQKAKAGGEGREREREERSKVVDEKLKQLVATGVSALLDRKAEKLVVLKLSELTSLADYFVLATATNDRQAQALSDGIELTLKATGRRPLSIEGFQQATWILLDYGDVVFHVFNEEARRFYSLERLWGDAPDETASFAPGPNG